MTHLGWSRLTSRPLARPTFSRADMEEYAENSVDFAAAKTPAKEETKMTTLRSLIRVLNQAVRLNLERFPSDFAFQLSQDELANWRSQIVTSSPFAKMGSVETPIRIHPGRRGDVMGGSAQ